MMNSNSKGKLRSYILLNFVQKGHAIGKWQVIDFSINVLELFVVALCERYITLFVID